MPSDLSPSLRLAGLPTGEGWPPRWRWVRRESPWAPGLWPARRHSCTLSTSNVSCKVRPKIRSTAPTCSTSGGRTRHTGRCATDSSKNGKRRGGRQVANARGGRLYATSCGRLKKCWRDSSGGDHLAEGVGFEPTDPLLEGQSLSRRLP